MAVEFKGSMGKRPSPNPSLAGRGDVTAFTELNLIGAGVGKLLMPGGDLFGLLRVQGVNRVQVGSCVQMP